MPPSSAHRGTRQRETGPLDDPQLASFIDRISDSFLALDSEWRITYANEEAARRNGTTREALIGRDHWRQWPQTVGSEVERAYRRAVAEGVDVHFEHHYEEDDLWHAIHAYPADGGGLSIFYIDITAEKRRHLERERLLAEAEAARAAAGSRTAALWEREEQLAAIFSQAAVGIVQADLTGSFVLANRHFCDLLGFAHDELRGHTISSVTHPDDRPQTEAALVALFEGGPPAILENRYQRADGTFAWFESTVTLLRNRDGDPTGILSMTVDLTPQRHAEAERRGNELRLRLALEAGQLGTWELDLTTGVITRSLAYDRLLGYTESQGDWDFGTCLTHVVVDDRERVEGDFRRVVAAGGPWEVECRIQRADDGTTRWFWTHAEPFADATGQVTRYLGVVRDTTAEREREAVRERLLEGERAARAESEAARAEAEAARAAAEAANHAKGEFLAVMSHELRTPLNAIAGYAELLEMGIRGPVTAQQREDLRRIQKSERHLLGLINEVLSYARIETGSMQYTLSDVLVADAVVAAETLVTPQLRAKGLHYTWECDERLVVRADPEKLQQILLNLLSNAVKFTHARVGLPGTIEVRCHAEDDHVVLRVEDSGVGIPPDKLEAIFEPFVQVDSRLTREHEGTGLGLAISRDLARGMSGDLRAESTPGVGSVLLLTLPRGGRRATTERPERD